MSLLCTDCEQLATSCACGQDSDGRFVPAGRYDLRVSSDHAALADERRRVEARSRELARAFVASGETSFACPEKFVSEVRATIAEIGRWTNDRAERARLASLVVEASHATAARAA